MNNVQDVLGRDETISSITSLIGKLSDKKNCSCFSIDGKWGVGKTFILNAIVDKLNCYIDDKGNKKYRLFRYDCWKYDYYDEPIIAIVSVLMDEILSSDNIEKTKEVLKGLGGLVVGACADVANKITGIDFNSLLDKEDTKKSEIDSLFPIKHEIENVRNVLAEYAKDHTLVLFVDELDRCLPEYAIKVLERLHHIFNDIENIIVIIALDGKQLEHSVKNIFGNEIDYDRYIKKFIDFRVKIDEGHADDSFFGKYDNLFGKYNVENELREYLIEMIKLSRLDIRSIEKIIKKIESINELIANSNSEIMLMVELTIELFKEMGKTKSTEKENYKVISNNLNWFSKVGKSRDSILTGFLGKKLENYLVELRKSIISDMRIISGIPADKELINDKPIAIVFLVIDSIFDSNKLYLNNNLYKELIQKCKNYLELSRVIE